MISLTPIAHVRGGRAQPIDDHWANIEAHIELSERFEPEALAGLETFSHLEVIFRFHLVAPERERTGARHPRNRTDWPKVGIFAQRGKARPNRLGVSRCRILGVEGRRIHVVGLDAIDGTPVLDLKPWMQEFAPLGPVRQPPWSQILMADYYRS
jgi:tRNA-Thr(GGU) m(6)t(6)A37 methyltransferase TsaA